MLYTPRMEALLYDIHGNLPALEAVLADAHADGYILGGDYALFGGWPAETFARLKELPEPLWIRGNGERWTASPDEAPDNPVVRGAIAAAREALGEFAVLALAALPADAPARRHAHLPRLARLRRPLVPPRARRRRGGAARRRHRAAARLRPHPPARSAAPRAASS